VAFPLGHGYYNQGFWAYRQAFPKTLGEMLPAPLLQTDAHLITELSLPGPPLPERQPNRTIG
jgi:hypothetical protein